MGADSPHGANSEYTALVCSYSGGLCLSPQWGEHTHRALDNHCCPALQQDSYQRRLPQPWTHLTNWRRFGRGKYSRTSCFHRWPLNKNKPVLPLGLEEASSLAARQNGASISSALGSNPSHARLVPSPGISLVAKTGLGPVPASQELWGLEGDRRQRLEPAPRTAEHTQAAVTHGSPQPASSLAGLWLQARAEPGKGISNVAAKAKWVLRECRSAVERTEAASSCQREEIRGKWKGSSEGSGPQRAQPSPAPRSLASGEWGRLRGGPGEVPGDRDTPLQVWQLCSWPGGAQGFPGPQLCRL